MGAMVIGAIEMNRQIGGRRGEAAWKRKLICESRKKKKIFESEIDNRRGEISQESGFLTGMCVVTKY